MTQRNFIVRNGLTIDGTTSGDVSIAAPAVAGTQSYTLPTAQPASNGYVLASQTDGTMSWVNNSAAGTTYTIDASSVTGGANFNLVGSDATTDTIKFASGTNVTVSRTDANTITIASTDTNTTYDFNATSTTGGANLNLVGSDATTDTVKLTNGGHITATYTSGTEVTLGSDATDANTAGTIVARDGSGNFSASGATLGNVTVGVVTDQTISTTTGDLVLDSSSNTVVIGEADVIHTLTINGVVTPVATTGITSTSTSFTITHGSGTLSYAGGYIYLSGVTPAGYNGLWLVNTTGAGTINVLSTANLGTASVQGSIYYGRTVVGSPTDVVLSNLFGSQDAVTIGGGTATGQPFALNTAGNIFTTNNYIHGTVRNTTSLVNGDTWSLNAGAGIGYRGLSVSNSDDAGKRPSVVLRGYGAARPVVLGESAGGTVPTPTAVASGGVLVELQAAGYDGVQWTGDLNPSNLPGVSVTATEAWTSFASTGSSISGTTLTIGTLTSGTIAVNQTIYGSGITTATRITANISGSGSGSTWTVNNSQSISSTDIVGGSNGTRLLVRGQSPNTKMGAGANGTLPVSLIDHSATTATYIADAWTFKTRPTNTGGTNTNQLTLDVSGNAVLTGDLAVNGGDITTTQTTATVFNTTATTLNVGQAATTVSLGATTGTATVRNATTLLSGALNVRNGLTYNILATTAGASENTLTLLKQDSTSSADHGVMNFNTYRSSAGTYSATQNGDKLGEFKFNGQYGSGASPLSGNPAQIIGNATENWTVSAQGSAIQFYAVKVGTTTGVNVINANPANMSFRSDLLTINDSANVNLVGGNIVYGRQYLEAYSTQDQTNPVANAENLMSFNNTGISNGVSVVTNGTTLSRITMSTVGVYNIQFSAQLNQTTGGAHNAFIWLKKNGANVANTAGDTRVAGNGDRIMAAWNYIVSAAAGDYYELAWAADDTAVLLDYVAAAGVVPAIPSVILTVVPVGA